MQALENAKSFFDACEMQVAGWAGCKQYAAEGATFHCLASSYTGIHTLQAYCDQIEHAFTHIFPGASGELHATAYDATRRIALLYGDSLIQHSGEQGPTPATHRTARIPFCLALTMDEAGKIQHLEKIFDETSGRNQLQWPAHEAQTAAAA